MRFPLVVAPRLRGRRRGGQRAAPRSLLRRNVDFQPGKAQNARMADRTFKPDLTGSDESLDHLLDRLRAQKGRKPSRKGRDDWDHFVTSRRPPGGAGGAEAPIPRETPEPDLYAPL